MSTKLIFITPPGRTIIPAGQSLRVGHVDVSQFSKIRVFAEERAGSRGVNIRLTISERISAIDELVAQLDVLQLSPKSQVTRAYDVPGTELVVFADAMGGTGKAMVEIWIYGN